MLKVANSVINASQIKTPITFVGDVTLSTGNLVIGTAGKGIDFSATTSGSGTMTSELLADYEEGTWTPTVSTSGGDFTSYTSSGTYTRIGRIVELNFTYNVTNGVGGSGFVTVSNLPFTAAGTTEIGGAREINLTGLPGYISFFSTTILIVQTLTNTYLGTTNYIVNGSITYTLT